MSVINDLIVLTTANGNRYIIDSGMPTILVPEVGINFDTTNGSLTVVKNKKPFASIDLYDNKGGAELIKEDVKGNIYLDVIDEVADSSYIFLEETVRKYSKKGKFEGAFRVPIEDYVIYPRKLVHISDNGQIYLMLLKTDSIEILKIELEQNYESKMEKLKKSATLLSDSNNNPNTLGEESLVQPMLIEPGVPSRSSVQSRAEAMIGLSWSYKYQNATNKPTSATKPAYLSSYTFISPTTTWTLSGIPYCWGGFDSVDRSSQPAFWSNFKDAMNKGKFAGNVNTDTLG